MKISNNFSSKQFCTNTQAFKGQRLVKLLARRQFGQAVPPIPLAVTKLSVNEDKQLMQAISSLWDKKTTHGPRIIPAFLKQPKDEVRKFSFMGFYKPEFYMLENLGEKDPINRVKALLMLNNYKNILFVNFLQSASQIDKKKFDGGGSILIYGLVKIAEKLKKSRIELKSSVDEWYDQLGFLVPNCGKFYFPYIGDTILPKKGFANTSNIVKNKYGLVSI